jgi:hypothetical protein
VSFTFLSWRIYFHFFIKNPLHNLLPKLYLKNDKLTSFTISSKHNWVH